MKVKFKRFSSHAHLPTKSTVVSAFSSFDIYSAKDVTLGPGVTKAVDLDLGFQFLKKYVCRIYPRSSLSLKPSFLGGRVIDSDYRFLLFLLTSFRGVSILKKEIEFPR